MTDPTWVPVDNGTVVSYPFQAPQTYIDNYKTTVVDPAHITTPPWFTSTVTFVDVSAVTPTPSEGSTVANGVWTYPPPPPLPKALSVSPGSIPPDGKTAATVTYTNGQPGAPTSVVFNVNGNLTTVAVANETATLQVASATAGDVILIQCDGLTTTLQVTA